MGIVERSRAAKRVRRSEVILHRLRQSITSQTVLSRGLSSCRCAFRLGGIDSGIGQNRFLYPDSSDLCLQIQSILP